MARQTTWGAAGYHAESLVYWGSAVGFYSGYASLTGYGPATVVVGDADADGFEDVILPGVLSNTGYGGAFTHIYSGSAASPSHSTAGMTSLSTGGGYEVGFLVGDTVH